MRLAIAMWVSSQRKSVYDHKIWMAGGPAATPIPPTCVAMGVGGPYLPLPRPRLLESSDSMRILEEHLRDLSNRVLVDRNLSEEDAEIVTDILVEAELRGRATHGMIRLPGIADRVGERPRQAMKLARESGLCVDRRSGESGLPGRTSSRKDGHRARRPIRCGSGRGQQHESLRYAGLLRVDDG